MLLAAGTSGMTFIGFFFLRVLPHTPYHAVPGGEGSLSDSQRLRRTSSDEAKIRAGRGLFAAEAEPGMSPPTHNNYHTNPAAGSEGRAPSAAKSLAAASSPNDVEAAANRTRRRRS
jgi:hypothetical protein